MKNDKQPKTDNAQDLNSRNVKISPEDYKDKGHGQKPQKSASNQGDGEGPIDGAEGESYGSDSSPSEGQFGVTDRRH